MIRFASSGGVSTAIFTESEGSVLASLAIQVAELIQEAPASDPALGRLLPHAYPDDPVAQEEFRRLTGDDLTARKAANAKVIADALAPGHWPREVVLELAESVRWLRALTDIRLVLADRLDVDDEGLPAADADEGMLAVYDWLGGVQDSLVQALDGDGT
jgi:hypothetical protein